MGRNDTKLLHLVCPSPIGALPLADIIITREDAKTIKFAFHLLKSVLPEHAFYRRGGQAGPQVIMTDMTVMQRRQLFQRLGLTLCCSSAYSTFYR